MTRLENSDWLRSIINKEFRPPLKTYADSLLFYSIGAVVQEHLSGDILEIGVGGSTAPLIYLANQFKSQIHLVDNEHLNKIDEFCGKFVSSTNIIKHRIDSTTISKSSMTELSYVHVDGSKNYNIAKNDIEKSLENLSEFGIICQDDYGNNRWPTIASIIHEYILTGKLKMLIVGDSSAWLCRPHVHSFWMKFFRSDVELSWIFEFVNANNSQNIGSLDEYFFLNACLSVTNYIRTDEKDKFQLYLLQHSLTPGYLVMPYPDQARAGIRIAKF